ncbi:MAG: DUF1499 domain-containing protein [Acidobacteriota bacterium]|nr:DUF1499 domain-containing protein [Acidobacteriota bacterium]MDH3528593.1 DUF1499 domain-containing protein [Acidobacteriota bacterium]
MKKAIIGVLVLLIGIAVGIVVAGRIFFPDNIAQTFPDGGAKNLNTRTYQSDAASARKASKEVIAGLSTWGGSWKLVDETDGGAEARLKVEVPVVIFTDDLEVTIKDAGDGMVEVNVKSQSRVGKSDFGENARHVRKFLDALDKKLKQE